MTNFPSHSGWWLSIYSLRVFIFIQNTSMCKQLRCYPTFPSFESLFFFSLSNHHGWLRHFTTPDAEVRTTTTTTRTLRFFSSHARDGLFFTMCDADIPTCGRSIAPRTPTSGCDLFRRAGGPARARDRSLSLCDTRTTRATGFDAVKRDETMRENVMFFLLVASGGFRTRDAARRGRGRRG